MSCIESYFTVVAESNNFLELDYMFLKSILYSSKLHITSEFDIVRAADIWISYNCEQRLEFAKDLLLTVRLPLLTDPALKCLFCEYSFCKVDECKSIIVGVVNKNESVVSKLPKKSFVIRYCDQNLLNVLVSKPST